MGVTGMRLFVNLLYNFKKNEKFPELFAKLRGVLAEYGWEWQRLLFHFDDVNDAQTEGKTPHAMLMKAFPPLAPYWRSGFAEYKEKHPNQKPLPAQHSYSYISNFPGRKAGKPVFAVPDAAVDLALMERVFAKIPRPCAFFSALMVLDGIDWRKRCDLALEPEGTAREESCDLSLTQDGDAGEKSYGLSLAQDGDAGTKGYHLSPAMDWVVILGKEEKDDWEAGYWPGGMDFDEICPFYQSNSIRIGKSWDLAPELAIQVEVFPGEGLAEVKRVEEAFSKYFGTPTKRYTRAVTPWEEREAARAKRREMQEFFARWSKKIRLEMLQKQAEVKEYFSFRKEASCRTAQLRNVHEQKCVPEKLLSRMAPSGKAPEPLYVTKKSVSRAAMKKRFFAKNALEHYPLSRWDDVQCYQKYLAHNYHLEVGIAINTEPPAAGVGRNPVNSLYIECIGWNFELFENVAVEDFAVPEVIKEEYAKSGTGAKKDCPKLDIKNGTVTKNSGESRSVAGNLGGSRAVVRNPAGTKDVAGELAFALWQEYLDRFEAEVVPELFRIFGETPKEFVCDSRRMTRANEGTIGTKYSRF